MKKRFFIALLFTLSSCALLSPNPNRENILSNAPLGLKPFTSDYCTDWPNGTRDNPNKWRGCCFSHDIDYWIGGTELERKASDKRLKECVKISSSMEAFLMYIGVRMGGTPGNASYSWGYGWTIKRDYQKIPKQDLEKARSLLIASEFNQKEETQKLIRQFIDDILNKKIQDE